MDGRKLTCHNPARFVQPFQQNSDLWQTDRRTQSYGLFVSVFALVSVLRDFYISSDEKWFKKIVTCPDHILRTLLPPPTAQNYSLRNRPHNRQLPDRISRITDCNFTVRTLYRNMYWLSGLYFSPALCSILAYNCGLTVRNKRICYVMLCCRYFACMGHSSTGLSPKTQGHKSRSTLKLRLWLELRWAKMVTLSVWSSIKSSLFSRWFSVLLAIVC